MSEKRPIGALRQERADLKREIAALKKAVANWKWREKAARARSKKEIRNAEQILNFIARTYLLDWPPSSRVLSKSPWPEQGR
jgi:septal ring factor EnvC (AmiA/AmiB activator)